MIFSFLTPLIINKSFVDYFLLETLNARESLPVWYFYKIMEFKFVTNLETEIQIWISNISNMKPAVVAERSRACVKFK